MTGIQIDFSVEQTVRVIESLDRRRRENKRVGWLYILRNPAYREVLLKIGRTDRPPWHRQAELSKATGVPGQFQLIYFVHVGDTVVAERHVHSLLSEFRLERGKEFFHSPLSEAVAMLDDAAARYPVRLGTAMNSPILPQAFPRSSATCIHCGSAVTWRNMPGARPKCPRCKVVIDVAPEAGSNNG